MVCCLLYVTSFTVSATDVSWNVIAVIRLINTNKGPLFVGSTEKSPWLWLNDESPVDFIMKSPDDSHATAYGDSIVKSTWYLLCDEFPSDIKIKSPCELSQFSVHSDFIVASLKSRSPESHHGRDIKSCFTVVCVTLVTIWDVQIMSHKLDVL